MANNELKTVIEACQLQDDVLNINATSQVEDISSLNDFNESKAEEFFSKNYTTVGMKKLLRECLQRLSGQSEQSVFVLRQAMGGGKTHMMLALGFLAKYPQLFNKVPVDITKGIKALKSHIVAINGRSISRDHFVWGEIADQLGKKNQFSEFWKHGALAPNQEDWKNLIGNEPTLIILDELPPYFDNAVNISVGEGTLAKVITYALSNLLSVVSHLPKTAIVLSDLTGSYEEASANINQAIRDFTNESNRKACHITPIDLTNNEIYEILKKRLFSHLPEPEEIRKIAKSYSKAIDEAVRSQRIGKVPDQSIYEKTIINSYPFHPSVKHIIALFKENPDYRQTRGLMQFVSKMLKSVWEGKLKNVYLIGCQHLDLTMEYVRNLICTISNLEVAITTDIMSLDQSARAQTIDRDKGHNYATMMANLLLISSLSESVDAVKGLSKSTLIEYLITPDQNEDHFNEVFEEFKKCWFLHKSDKDIESWYFSPIENLNKRIESCANEAPQSKIDAEIKRRLENVFAAKTKNAYSSVIALPKINEVHLGSTSPRICLVMSPDQNQPKYTQGFFESLIYKNGFCVVTGDSTSMGNLEEKVRKAWTIHKVKEELSDQTTHAQELQDLVKQAEFDINSSIVHLFNRVYFPLGDSSKEELVSSKLELSVPNRENKQEIDGEKAVEETLNKAKKLNMDDKSQYVHLIERAEQVLWPDNTITRVPWKEVVAYAQSRTRWIWLPPKGLEDLRDLAVSMGRWSYNLENNAYVDKNPKKPKATLNFSRLAYDEKTGEVEIELNPRSVGDDPIITMSKTADMKDAQKINGFRFKTKETKLFFRVEDSNEKDDHHESSEVTPWNNQLTLTHQVQYLPNKRIVELCVVPKGEIRWNITGINPKDGEIYKNPLEFEGSKEMILYVYAQDNGVEVVKDFKLRKSDSPQSIDETKPATLKKTVRRDDTKSSFDLLQSLKNNNGKMQNVRLDVGLSLNNICTNLGSAVFIQPQSIETAIEWSRQTLDDPNAEVQIRSEKFHFFLGYDLIKFAKELSININPNEVEQK